MMVMFVSDFYHGDWSEEMQKTVVGGAEAHDRVLISALEKRFKVHKYRSKEVTVKDVQVHSDKVWFLTNFGLLDPLVKQAFIDNGVKYFIYEHDHKYVMGRNPIVFPNFIAPEQYVDNKAFLLNANRVYVNTALSRDLMLKNLRVWPDAIKIYNVQGNFFSDDTFARVQALLSTPMLRKPRAFIIKTDEAAKSHSPAIEFAEQHQLDYDLIEKCEHTKLLEHLRSYHQLIYFTSCVDTFCRLIAEAMMLECRVITNPHQMGFYSEKNLKKLKGMDLVNYLRNRRDEVLRDMIQEIQNA